MEQKNVIINELQKYVSEKFNLGADYVITNFNAKKLSVTLTNAEHEVTVVAKGAVAERIMLEVAVEQERIAQLLEESEVEQ